MFRRASTLLTGKDAHLEVVKPTAYSLNMILGDLKDKYEDKYEMSKNLVNSPFESGKKDPTVEDKDFANLAICAQIIFRGNISYKTLYSGAILVEWFYMQSSGSFENPNRKAKPTNATHDSVMASLKKAHNIDEMEFKAALARAHIRIFERQGLLSEPYHLKRAEALLEDCFVNFKKKSLFDLSADQTMYCILVSKMQQKLNKSRFNAREKARKTLINHIPRLYLTCLLYRGNVGKALEVAKVIYDQEKLFLNTIPDSLKLPQDFGKEEENKDVKNEDEVTGEGEEETPGAETSHDEDSDMIKEKTRVKCIRQRVASALLSVAVCYMSMTAYKSALDCLYALQKMVEPPMGLNRSDLNFILGRVYELWVTSTMSLDNPLDKYLPVMDAFIQAKKDKELADFKAKQEAQRQWDLAKAQRKQAQIDAEEQEALIAELEGLNNPTSPSRGAGGGYGRKGGMFDGGSVADSHNGGDHDDFLLEDPAKKKVVAPVLDMKEVIAERLRLKEEHFRRRKELRRLRKLGLKPDDPEAEQKKKALNKKRSECKKWLANWKIWGVVAEKLQYLGLTPLAADLFRQGLLRDNAGFSVSPLWFRWAKACHRCGKEVDCKLALNQALHFDPDSSQIRIFRDHMDHLGSALSTKHATNVEKRTFFERMIDCQKRLEQEQDRAYVQAKRAQGTDAVFGTARALEEYIKETDYGKAKAGNRSGRARMVLISLKEVLELVVNPSAVEAYEDYAATRVGASVVKVAKQNKWEREEVERKRLEGLWALKPPKTPVLVWDNPPPMHYPVFLKRGLQLNAKCPVPPPTPRAYGELIKLGDEDDEEFVENQETQELAEEGSIGEESMASFGSAGELSQEGSTAGHSAMDARSIAKLSVDESLANNRQEDIIPGKYYYEPDESEEPLNAGEHELRVTFIPDDLGVYTKCVAVVHFTVMRSQDNPELLWDPPQAAFVGTLLSETQLNARVRIADKVYSYQDISDNPDKLGQLTFRPTFGLKLPFGVHTLRAIYKPADERNYGGTYGKVPFEIKPFVPILEWERPVPITYPKKLSSDELRCRCTNLQGTFVYTPSKLDTPLSVGEHTLHCAFWPYNNKEYRVEELSTTLTVQKRTPSIQWNTPPFVYVHELPCLTYETHLNAIVLFEKRNDVPDLKGVFRYNVDEYTWLSPGHYPISCVFFPDDSDNYSISEHAVTLTVRCKPKVVWKDLAILRQGNAITEAHLCAYCEDCAGDFIYEPALYTIPERGGLQDFTLSFKPHDPSVYDDVTVVVEVDVVPKLKPNLSWTPGVVHYGQKFTADNVLNAQSNIPGIWVYSGQGTLPVDVQRELGVNGLITAEMTSHLPLLDSGKFVLQANFYPEDANTYQELELAATIEVEKLAVEMKYGPFTDLHYGDAIHEELHCRAEIVGTALQFLPNVDAAKGDSGFGCFKYTAVDGTILKAGTHDLTVTYNPIDTTNFVEASSTVQLKVKRHDPVIDWPVMRPIKYSERLTELQLCAKILPNERDLLQAIDGELTYSLPMHHRFAKVGRHKIECRFVPADAFNYSTVSVMHEISVRRWPIEIFWDHPEEIFEGQKLTADQLNAVTNFEDLGPEEGKLVYDPPIGKKLEAGSHSLLCTFKPHPDVKDNFDMRKGYAEVQILVVQARGGLKSRGR